LCKEIYGSSAYYFRVAADNGLDDFRNLIPGQKLNFPPLQSGEGSD
jgi:nucleoid-associated protein YgaU